MRLAFPYCLKWVTPVAPIRTPALLYAILLVGIMSAVCHSGLAQGTDFGKNLEFWEQKVFYCTDRQTQYPSKHDPNAPGECDDGDMTLFNGLLCAAGDSRGCEAVRLSQGNDGRWWRAPRRIGWEAPTYDVSFSPDQALGVMLYAVQTKDRERFARWIGWMEENRPCILGPNDNCLLRGWPRYCPDDSKDKRCTLRPADCSKLEATGNYLGLKVELCKNASRDLHIPKEILEIPEEDWALGSAIVNKAGYSRHLAGVTNLLLRKLGMSSTATAVTALILSSREPRNPFFAYLLTGKSAQLGDLILTLCPSPEKPSRARRQWAWERDDNEHAWEESMYWDCIFMARLLND